MKKHTALKPFDLSYDGINSVHVGADDVIEVPDALAPGLEAEGYISAAITDVAPAVSQAAAAVEEPSVVADPASIKTPQQPIDEQPVNAVAAPTAPQTRRSGRGTAR